MFLFLILEFCYYHYYIINILSKARQPQSDTFMDKKATVKKMLWLHSPKIDNSCVFTSQ